MNHYKLIWLSLPLAWLAAAAAVNASPSQCKVPNVAPVHGALYIDRDVTTARLDDHFDMIDPIRAAFINGAVHEHPSNERLRLGRGSALAVMNHDAAARRDFAVALKHHPNDAHAHWSYGWALFNLGDDACAIHQWQRAAQLSGGHPSWLPYAMAESYWRLGRHDLALRWYGAAVNAQPSRWGSEASIRASTYGRNWSDVQRSMLISMLHAWQRQQAGSHGNSVASAAAPGNPGNG